MKSFYIGFICVGILCFAGCGKKDASTELMPISTGHSAVNTFGPVDVIHSKDPENSKNTENTENTKAGH